MTSGKACLCKVCGCAAVQMFTDYSGFRDRNFFLRGNFVKVGVDPVVYEHERLAVCQMMLSAKGLEERSLAERTVKGAEDDSEQPNTG